jgi:hypothetical protein
MTTNPARAQRDHAAKADAAEKDQTLAGLSDRQAKRGNLIVLADEQTGLVGAALTKHVEGRDTKAPRDERRAVAGP